MYDIYLSLAIILSVTTTIAFAFMVSTNIRHNRSDMIERVNTDYSNIQSGCYRYSSYFNDTRCTLLLATNPLPLD